jgi:hypothetical protein
VRKNAQRWDTILPSSMPNFPSGPGPLRTPGGDLRDWAQGAVEKIRVAAIGGRFRFLPYYDPYTEETPEIRREYPRMLVESTVKAAFQTKVLSVISLPVQFNASDDNDPRQNEAADFCRWTFKHLKGGTAGAGWSILHPALIKGLSVCEKVRPAEPLPSGKFRGKRPITVIKSKDTDFLQLGIDAYRNPEVVRGLAYNAGRSWPVEDFVLFTYLSLFENPAGMSDFRAAYPDYWRKKTVWQLRQLHLDKFTGPYLVGKYQGQDQKDALEAALTEARATTWMTLPVGAMVDAIDLSMRGTEDYEKAIKDCDRGMLIAIVGAHLQILEGQTTGGRGNTKVHKETAELIQWWLADRLAQAYYEQVAVPLTADNYWDVEPPEVSVGAVTEEEVIKSLQVYELMQKLGAKISSREVYKIAGKTKPTEADDVLVAPAPQPQQSAPGGDAVGASPFSERVRRFCMEGENKGLPGPCPEGKPSAGLPDDKALAAARIEPLKKADAVHGAGGLAKVTVGNQSYFFKAAPASEIKREAAVSDLARLAAVGVPQARAANVAGKEGLLSGWAEGKNGDEDKAGFYAAVAKDPAAAAKLVAFHFLVGAEDRHKGNVVVGPDGSLASLDHSDALAPDRSPADAADLLGQDDLMAALEKAQGGGGGDVRLDAGAVGAVAAKTGEMAGLLRSRGMEGEAKELEARGRVLAALAREPSPTEGRLKALAGTS